MINAGFEDKMKQLEQEREELVKRLSPERQEEYLQKKNEFNQNDDELKDAFINKNQTDRLI